MAVRMARETLVRQCVREAFYERIKIVRPTKQGLKEIDENHPLYTLRFMKGKPVWELVGDQFLQLNGQRTGQVGH
jgi:transcription elongation factor SPT6